MQRVRSGQKSVHTVYFVLQQKETHVCEELTDKMMTGTGKYISGQNGKSMAVDTYLIKSNSQHCKLILGVSREGGMYQTRNFIYSIEVSEPSKLTPFVLNIITIE